MENILDPYDWDSDGYCGDSEYDDDCGHGYFDDEDDY